MKKLRTLRHAMGMSAEKLGRRADLTERTIFDIELGRASPTLRTLRKLATALNVDPAELMDEPPEEEKNQ